MYETWNKMKTIDYLRKRGMKSDNGNFDNKTSNFSRYSKNSCDKNII